MEQEILYLAEELGYRSSDSTTIVDLHRWLIDLHGIYVTPIIYDSLFNRKLRCEVHLKDSVCKSNEEFNSWDDALKSGIKTALLKLKSNIDEHYNYIS